MEREREKTTQDLRDTNLRLILANLWLKLQLKSKLRLNEKEKRQMEKTIRTIIKLKE
jgi:hypothetical protein